MPVTMVQNCLVRLPAATYASGRWMASTSANLHGEGREPQDDDDEPLRRSEHVHVLSLRSAGRSDVNHERDGSIVDQADLHHGAEPTGRDLDAALAQRRHHGVHHRLGDAAGGGAVPRRAAALPGVGVQSNWLTTSTGAPSSSTDLSSRRMRSSLILRAIAATWSGPSSCVTPTSASRPGRSMAPTVSRRR